jgi:serine protease Do
MLRSKVLLTILAVLVVVGVLTVTQSAAPAARSVAIGPVATWQRVVDRLLAPQAAALPQEASAVQPAPVQKAAPTPAMQPASAQAPAANNQPLGTTDESPILEAIYRKVNPSVVQVVNLAQSSGRLRSLGTVPQGEGSGFVWDTQGHIVTNDHVVEGADQLQVIFADGTQVDAKLVGTDPNGDIAVIQVDPSQVNQLVPVEVGDMSQVQVGQLVAAIGNPFGFQGTMTRGIVSALGRSIPSQTQYSIPEAIQTDAAINPGNSGGPLLNEQGQVIGVNDQIQSASGSNSGVGFAIPISIVDRIVPSLIKSGSYQHAYLGLSGGTYSRAWSQALGFPVDAKGVYVFAAAQGGPAARAGLKGGTQDTSVLLGVDNTGATYLQSGGDLITAVNGQPLTKMDDLLMYLEEKTSPGQTVQLSVTHSNGQQATLSVRLSARPAQTIS